MDAVHKARQGDTAEAILRSSQIRSPLCKLISEKAIIRLKRLLAY